MVQSGDGEYRFAGWSQQRTLRLADDGVRLYARRGRARSERHLHDTMAARRALARRALRPELRRLSAAVGPRQPRAVRDLDGSLVEVHPDRARCTACRATHLVLDATLLPHRTYTTRFMGRALVAAAGARPPADRRRPRSAPGHRARHVASATVAYDRACAISRSSSTRRADTLPVPNRSTPRTTPKARHRQAASSIPSTRRSAGCTLEGPLRALVVTCAREALMGVWGVSVVVLGGLTAIALVPSVRLLRARRVRNLAEKAVVERLIAAGPGVYEAVDYASVPSWSTVDEIVLGRLHHQDRVHVSREGLITFATSRAESPMPEDPLLAAALAAVRRRPDGIGLYELHEDDAYRAALRTHAPRPVERYFATDAPTRRTPMRDGMQSVILPGRRESSPT